MFKNSIVLCFVFVVTAASAAFSQSVGAQIEIPAALSQANNYGFDSPDVIKTPPRQEVIAERKAARRTAPVSLAPAPLLNLEASRAAAKTGDVAPGEANIVSVHQDRKMLVKGQEVNVTIQGLEGYSRPIFVSGTYCGSGISGQTDNADLCTYFAPELTDGSGVLPYGIHYGQSFNVFSHKMGIRDKAGEGYLTLTIWDLETGKLLEQTFNYIYFKQAGPIGVWNYRIENITESTFGATPILLVKGKFPVMQTVYITLGKPGLDFVPYTYEAMSPDGVTILLVRPPLPFRAVELDATLHHDKSRTDDTLVAAYVLPDDGRYDN